SKNWLINRLSVLSSPGYDGPHWRYAMIQSTQARIMVLSFWLAIGSLTHAEPPAKLDTHGDPLPPGTIARLGTVRWRHGDGTRFLSFLPDGKTLLSVGHDATVRQWEVATGKETRRFSLSGQLAESAKGPLLPNWLRDEEVTGPSITLSANGKILAFKSGGEA